MNILGIETSCDETAVAIVKNGTNVLHNAISSSMKDFEFEGGVIPELAARKQITALPILLQAIITTETIDLIAFTNNPGLQSSLVVGRSAAYTLGSILNLPVVPVDHIHGHMSSIWLDNDQDIQFPLLTVSISGGHTELWYRTSHTDGEKLGATRDDAIGEAFDKAARMLDLPYPGGPSIALAAKKGNPLSYVFPAPLQNANTCDCSYSGLKTALKYLIEPMNTKEVQKNTANIAASFEYALCKHLLQAVARVIKAKPDIKEIHLVGGVSANATLRTMTKEHFSNTIVRWPSKTEYCTDNAAMIAASAFFSQD